MFDLMFVSLYVALRSCFKDCSSRFLYLVDLHLERHIYFSLSDVSDVDTP